MNLTPDEQKMYADLRASGDTHSEAINTIRGERLMRALVTSRR